MNWYLNLDVCIICVGFLEIIIKQEKPIISLQGKYAKFTGYVSAKEVEKFISLVLSGDAQFKKSRQKLMIK